FGQGGGRSHHAVQVLAVVHFGDGADVAQQAVDLVGDGVRAGGQAPHHRQARLHLSPARDVGRVVTAPGDLQILQARDAITSQRHRHVRLDVRPLPYAEMHDRATDVEAV